MEKKKYISLLFLLLLSAKKLKLRVPVPQPGFINHMNYNKPSGIVTLTSLMPSTTPEPLHDIQCSCEMDKSSPIVTK